MLVVEVFRVKQGCDGGVRLVVRCEGFRFESHNGILVRKGCLAMNV